MHTYTGGGLAPSRTSQRMRKNGTLHRARHIRAPHDDRARAAVPPARSGQAVTGTSLWPTNAAYEFDL